MGFITDITAATPTTGTFFDGQPSGMDNDGGAIMGPIWGGESFSTPPYVSAVAFAPADDIITVVSGVNNVVSNAAGTWNFAGGSGVIVKATTSLGGVANDAALFGASDSANGDSIHQAGTIRSRLYKTAIRAGDWNDFSGWSSAPSVVYSGGWDNAAGIDDSANIAQLATDNAANPTSDFPGNLQYDLGQIPVQTGYHPRYLW
tara:strand:- start:4926 stop:5534 length:609 start_codon:yes stop_codon:yes gene_type:complete